MFKHVCPICGKDFVTEKKVQKFCSQKCYNTQRSDYYKYHQDEFEICNDVVIVKNNEYKILLDKEDFLKLKHKIIVAKKKKDRTPYAHIRLNNKMLRLHRLILNCPNEMVIDHINHNGLDNRKCNLRIVTVRDNTLNRQLPKNNQSGYIGICYKKQEKVWEAYYCYKYLGRFKNIKDAIKARTDYIESQDNQEGIDE